MEQDKPSKSQLKREAQALQKLGESLIALTPERLARIPLPDDLRDAIVAARGMARQRSALKRQRQYIGRLMRNVDDPESIRQALERIERH